MKIPARLGWGASNLAQLKDLFVSVFNSLKLTALKTAVVTGADTDTDITVTGIDLGDTLIGVINLTDGASVSATITAANKIRTSTDTTNKKLLVIFMDVSAIDLQP